MQFGTVRSYYNTFCMILLGVIVGVSLGVFAAKVNWYAMLIVAALVLLPYMFFSTILSIDIVDQHLVVKTISCFRKRTEVFDIDDVELQLFYTPAAPRRSAYYSMYVVKGKCKLHEIQHDVAELTIFIERFNKKKEKTNNLKFYNGN